MESSNGEPLLYSSLTATLPSPFGVDAIRHKFPISGEIVTDKLKMTMASPFVKALAETTKRFTAPLAMAALMCALGAQSFAQEATEAAAAPAPAVTFDGANTAWMLVSCALVMLMTPGLAFFYGGLVRSKNMLNTMLMSFGAMAIMGILWVVCGYSLAFGDATGGGNLVGSLQYAFFNGVGLDAPNGEQTIPHYLFAIFQGMFFILTPALISGSLVERMKFSTFFVFMALWGLLVYCPVAHWVWGGGWIGGLGVMDFAGGGVVHVNAGFGALGACLVLGPRKGYGKRPMLPHSLPLCLLGVGLLWFGWFGFNAGSALAADKLGVLAFGNTQIAAAAAMLVWMLLDQITRKEMTALGAGTGAVAGLVGITPACGFVTPMGAILVGAITSGICYVMATLRAKGKVDDSLDAFAVHGVGGFVGAVLTGVFASAAIKPINDLVLPGLLEGRFDVFFNQFWTTAVIAVYSCAMSAAICLVLKAVMGLRADEASEERGLDISLHGEEAYASESAG
jgi:Amt family ammonium transporter